MRPRTNAARRGIAAVAASFVAVLLGVLLAPTAASAAVGQPEVISGNSVAWRVVAGGVPVGGAEVTLEYTNSNKNFSFLEAVQDCTSAPCGTGRWDDIDPDPGEFQVRESENGNRGYRVSILRAPPDHEPAEAGQARSYYGQSYSPAWLGDLDLRRMPEVSCSAAYALLGNGSVRQIAVSAGASTAEFGSWSGVTGSANALAATSGSVLYAVDRSNTSVNAILRFDRTSGWQRTTVTSQPSGMPTIVAGAVERSSGRYLFGGFSGTGSSQEFRLYALSGTSEVSSVGSVATGGVTDALGGSGDMAFDGAGNLVIARTGNTSSIVTFSVTPAALAAGGAMQATASAARNVGMTGVAGLAFAQDGALLLSNATTLRSFPAADGASTLITESLGPDATDLATCAAPPAPATLTVSVHVASRDLPSDAFRVQVAGASALGPADTGVSAAAQAGPTAVLGGSYALTGSVVSGAVANYSSRITCTGTAFTATDAWSASVAVPAGSNVACTVTVTSLVTRVVVRKELQSVDRHNLGPVAGWNVEASISGPVSQLAPVAGVTRQSTDQRGRATWTVRHDSSASNAAVVVSEEPRQGYVLESLLCSVTTGSSTTTLSSSNGLPFTLPPVAPGSAVDCLLVNRELPTTLTLRNRVLEVPGSKLSAPLPADWTLRADRADGTVALAGPDGTAARVAAGSSLSLSSGGGDDRYVPGSWTCIDQFQNTLSVTGSTISPSRGTEAVCTIEQSTAELVLLQHVEGAEGLAASDFTLTANHETLGVETRSGAETPDETTAIRVRPGATYELASTSDALHVPLRLERFTGADWTSVEGMAPLEPGSTAIYRFVALSPLPFVLPITGGIGADLYQLGGLGLLVLAIGALVVRALRRRLPMTPMSISNIPASPQEGTATMATIKKSRAARIAAGAGALALASLVALGGAAPASAAGNIDDDAPAKLTIHAIQQPEVAGTVGHIGNELDDLPGERIAGVTYRIQRITNIDLTTAEGWSNVRALNPETVTELAEPIEATTTETEPARFDSASTEYDFSVGAYVVRQITPVGPSLAAGVVIPAKPFIVTVPQAVSGGETWNYDVHVYPKTSEVGVSKAASAPAHQVLGSTVTWTITTGVPVPVRGLPNADDTAVTSYSIVDQLAPQLTVADDAAISVSIDHAGTVTPVGGVSITRPSATNDRTLRIDFESAEALGALAAARGGQVVVEIPTVVNQIGSGTITNSARVFVNGSEVVSKDATDHWGSLELFAHANTAANTPLAGAVFKLVDGAGVVLKDPVTGEDLANLESDENGIVRIDGLRTGGIQGVEYRLVLVEAPGGFRLPTGASDTVSRAIVAGDGSNEVSMAFEQVPAYALPVTGGDGQLMFMLGGAGLVLLAVGFALVRRSKADQQA